VAIGYLWLSFGRRTVVKLKVTVPVVAVKVDSVPLTLNNGILGANNARTVATIKPVTVDVA